MNGDWFFFFKGHNQDVSSHLKDKHVPDYLIQEQLGIRCPAATARDVHIMKVSTVRRFDTGWLFLHEATTPPEGRRTFSLKRKKRFNLFLTCGLCRSSSCCFGLGLSFSICCCLIWLLPPMTPGGSCPPCFTGALWEILCWFRAAKEKGMSWNRLLL